MVSPNLKRKQATKKIKVDKQKSAILKEARADNKNYIKILDKYNKAGIDFKPFKHHPKSTAQLFRYESEDSTFDYEAYVKSQIYINLKKIDFPGPDAKRIAKISQDIKKNIPDLKFGLCHGTRQGYEQSRFRKSLGVEVIGTEISYTATEFSDTIEWDFHNIKEEWLGNVCFIFSNSLDHSYDPITCLKTWMSCIKPGGRIYLQRGNDDRPNKSPMLLDTSLNVKNDKDIQADCFQCTETVFAEIVKLAGQGEWKILKPKSLEFHRPYKKYIAVLVKK